MRTRKTVFILTAGKAGVGKSTLGEYLAEKLSDIKDIKVINTAFAFPIKRLAMSAFGWDGKKDEKGRRLLQVIGTEAGREYDENIWVKKMLDFSLTSSVYPPNFVIVDDWRYPNEFSYIEDQKIHDVVKIRVEAPIRERLKWSKQYNHASETSLPSGFADNGKWNDYYKFVINNDGNFESLYIQGDRITDFLEKKFILE